jgi:general secretion pathway protein D
MKLSYIALALLCLSPAFATASDADPKQGAIAAGSPNSSRDTDLRALLRDVGARTHKTFVVDPRAPQSVDLAGLDHKDVTYPVLLSILQVNGMIVIADGGVMQVIPNTDARQAASPIVAPENLKTLDDEWVTCILPLKNMNAAQLVPALRPLMPQYAQLAPLVDRNALLIVDRTANVRRMIEIIRILEKLPKFVDAPPAAKTS